MKKTLVAGVGALVAAGAGLTVATSASADVACNRFGECWHVHARIDYPADVGITFYDDSWKFPDTHYVWRKDRDDHGYWWHGHWRHF
jgi:hypothetical protein